MIETSRKNAIIADEIFNKNRNLKFVSSQFNHDYKEIDVFSKKVTDLLEVRKPKKRKRSNVDIKLNVTQDCNLKCKYCYAKMYNNKIFMNQNILAWLKLMME